MVDQSAGRMRGNRTCRPGCGACCIALSISSPIPGMSDGKPAGVRCVQLSIENLCMIYDIPGRPEVCARLKPSVEICGESRDEALRLLGQMEEETAPDTGE